MRIGIDPLRLVVWIGQAVSRCEGDLSVEYFGSMGCSSYYLKLFHGGDHIRLDCSADWSVTHRATKQTAFAMQDEP